MTHDLLQEDNRFQFRVERFQSWVGYTDHNESLCLGKMISIEVCQALYYLRARLRVKC